MKQFGERFKRLWNSKIGFFLLSVILFWAKTFWAYWHKFTLGSQGSMQHLILAINPIPTTIILFGIALFIKGKKSYIIMLIIDFLTTTWLFANILYYREFSDFLTFNLIKGTSSVSNNLNKGIAGIVKPSDFLVYLDIVILIVLLVTRIMKIDKRALKIRYAAAIEVLGVVLLGLDLSMSYNDRSGLLTRTFDNNYIVKYLGLNTYAVYDGIRTERVDAAKRTATKADLAEVEKYVKDHAISPNVQYHGIAKGKNVFIIHLESFQQFLIDYKWDGQEVTPNIDKLYHDKNTISFDNFFNQVGQGKTADAEMMLENSLFGLPEGAAMVTDGTTNTFQAAPEILDEHGYTTAAFHGDVPSFWNRDNTYKSWGYEYFFSKGYFQNGKDFDVGYGLKDKIFLKDSAQYIQQLPQPFYAKLITVTNHYPYLLDKQNQTIAPTNTGDNTVDGYVQTAHYLDQAIGEFIQWLKKTGLYNNSVLVLYGDHYGISGNHDAAMAKLTGIKNYNAFNNAQYQRVPFMIHMPGLKGGINHTYGGEIDVLPTLLNLLGIKNNFIEFGHDLLAKNRSQLVAFRNGDFVSPTYTKVGSTYYYTQTGKVVTDATKEQQRELAKMSKSVTTELAMSDKVLNGDLLRFYHPSGFKQLPRSDFNYQKTVSLKRLKEAQVKEPTSLMAENDGKSFADLYQTDAPELKKDK